MKCEAMTDFGFVATSASQAATNATRRKRDATKKPTDNKGTQNGQNVQQTTVAFECNTSQTSKSDKNNSENGKEGEQNDSPCGSSDERSKMAENLLQVNIFFQSLNVQTITEMPKYPVSDAINYIYIYR